MTDEGYMGFTKKDIDKWQNTSFAWKSFCWILKKLGMNKKNDYYAKSSNGISFIKAVSRIAPVVMSVFKMQGAGIHNKKRIIRRTIMTIIVSVFAFAFIYY